MTPSQFPDGVDLGIGESRTIYKRKLDFKTAGIMLIGAIALWFAIATAMPFLNGERANYVTVKGTVESVDKSYYMSDGGRRTSCTPIVAFTVDGSKHLARGDSEAASCVYLPGTAMDVRYDPWDIEGTADARNEGLLWVRIWGGMAVAATCFVGGVLRWRSGVPVRVTRQEDGTLTINP